MALGRGKTEHDGARDMSRKHGHWGHTEEAKEWASRARRRDEKQELAEARQETNETPEIVYARATGPISFTDRV
jgi:hypothetical protein